MNQINPLHIGGLLLVLMMFLFFKLGVVNDEIVEADLAFKESEKLAVNLSALKRIYKDTKKSKKKLYKILQNRSLKSENLTVKELKKSIKISAQSISSSSLNYLMGKILNDSFNITMLKVKKLSREKASFEMEIKW